MLLTTKEAAARLKLSVNTLQNWRSAQAGPPWKRLGGRAIRYDEDELDAWIKRADEAEREGNRRAQEELDQEGR